MPKINSLQTHLRKLMSVVHNDGPVARSYLAKCTGHSLFLISKLTERLLKRGLILETASAKSSGGRPPTLLSINPSIGRVVGVHMGTINLRAVVTDMCGNTLAYRRDKSWIDRSPGKALQHILDVVRGTLREAKVKRGELSAIGIGIGGVLDREQGIVLSWPKFPSWHNVPVKGILQHNLRTMVEVDDVPRTMALAERRYGKARSINEFIYVVLGAGTGTALFLGGQLYTGKGGFAGEFGHTSIDERGPLCVCGNRGCVETFVSASVIIHKAREALTAGLCTELPMIAKNNRGQVTLEAIAQAAEANDRFCRGLLSEVGQQVGIGLVNLINLLNPELIMLSGGLPKAAGKWLLPVVKHVIHERSMQTVAGQATVELSELSDIDWARGAALLVSEKAIQEVLLPTKEGKTRNLVGNK